MNLLCILFGHKMIYAEPGNMASGGKCGRRFCKYKRSPVAIPSPPWREAHPDPPTERPKGPAPDPPPVSGSLLRKLSDIEQYERAGRFRIQSKGNPSKMKYQNCIECFITEEFKKKLIEKSSSDIRIGEWTLTWINDELWILDGEGEGGVFDEQKLAEAIEAFYMEHF